MNNLLNLFIFVPLLGFIVSIIVPSRKEALLSRVAFITAGFLFISLVLFVIVWLIKGRPIVNIKDVVLFQTADYQFYIDFCFDKITAVYAIVGAFLTFLVTVYSRYYLHREQGYKRFFNAILFFYFGYNLTIFSGNLETLFIGWEILGISSFLLIAFYRDRYLPVKNGLKVFSIYRIGDVGLVLAMWMSHHLWHENITFIQLNNQGLVHEHLQSHSFIGVVISLMILLTAAAKSAQLPFSSWLPRAMEGPTPSSAIFYGSLSVHVGVFLLLKTFPFWENQLSVRILIAVLGLVTSVITSGIARVQSSVKAQIAYSSVSQIGLIFIEVAAGFENLALFHFAGNAFLRTYQLLVSPSVVSYLIREQFYNFIPRKQTIEDSIPKRIGYSFYVLSLKEWNLESFMYKLWSPLKVGGRKLHFLNLRSVLVMFVIIYLGGLACLFSREIIPNQIQRYLPGVFTLIGLIMVLKSFTERNSPLKSWSLIIMNHFWIVLAVSFNEHFKMDESLLYLSGVIFSGILGFWCLKRLMAVEPHVNLNQFHGHAYEHPRIAFIFLFACLGLAGFPITPTFIGEDVIFDHIHEDQFVLALFAATGMIVAGISVIRLYARIFLGPHVKTYHESAYRSS